LSDQFWPFVQNPGQYVGHEINIVRKPWDDAELRVALGFPDAYAVGSSSLAVHIVYDILNSTDGVLCERVFCPLPDAADRLRLAKLPLYSLESYRPVAQFDVLALSVQYELLYTNILEMLDLAGLPLRSADRTDANPLVIVGGSQAHNPEPFADFVDAVVLGEAEAALPALVETLRMLRRTTRDRRAILRELAMRLPWVYVPSLYEPHYRADGTFDRLAPTIDGLPTQISKAVVDDLDTMRSPTRPIVPFVQTVHERVNIEIMRGCPHLCRFCHEGHTRRPVRYRSKENIIALAEETLANTGLNEVSLFSLSSADHPQLAELFDELNARLSPRNISVALPSLRAERQLELIPKQTSQVRKSPMTIAIEAADPTLREVLHKPIDESAVFDAVRRAYACGWRQVKLYFIVGLPGETEESRERIIKFAEQVAYGGPGSSRRPAKVTASLSFFVPKPHTPLQWCPQQSLEAFAASQQQMRAMARSRRFMKLNFHDRYRSFVEAVFARGDRRLSAVLLEAWKRGARFDAWDEHFKYDHFVQAFETAGIDPTFYANRHIQPTETLPWEHLQPGSPKPVLLRLLADSLEPIGGIEAYFSSSSC
jgi:radical SAM family uncharacterized protein